MSMLILLMFRGIDFLRESGVFNMNSGIVGFCYCDQILKCPPLAHLHYQQLQYR